MTSLSNTSLPAECPQGVLESLFQLVDSTYFRLTWPISVPNCNKNVIFSTKFRIHFILIKHATTNTVECGFLIRIEWKGLSGRYFASIAVWRGLQKLIYLIPPLCRRMAKFLDLQIFFFSFSFSLSLFFEYAIACAAAVCPLFDMKQYTRYIAHPVRNSELQLLFSKFQIK